MKRMLLPLLTFGINCL